MLQWLVTRRPENTFSPHWIPHNIFVNTNIAEKNTDLITPPCTSGFEYLPLNDLMIRASHKLEDFVKA